MFNHGNVRMPHRLDRLLPAMLLTLNDDDYPHDLNGWQRVRESEAGSSTQQLTVVVPTLNEMNVGASQARTQIFLFLHADTRLPLDYAEHNRRAIEHPDVIGGAFRLGIDTPLASFRLIEWGANLKIKVVRPAILVVAHRC